ncbi:MAG: hypothetical protein GBAus27B_000469 [Mycoplasmataceae bacterium]|nr:MAG: hypothetical protein GBAus27B_000469 [Mycoplasmataceae bacterium]
MDANLPEILKFSKGADNIPGTWEIKTEEIVRYRNAKKNLVVANEAKEKTEQALAERGEITPTALTELREAKAKADADLVVANEAKERRSSCWTRRLLNALTELRKPNKADADCCCYEAKERPNNSAERERLLQLL